MTPKKSILIIALITLSTLAFLTMFYMLLKRENPNLLPSALINKPAPGFEEMALPPHPTFTPQDLAKGKITLVNFWASWCGPCREEHPHLKTLKEAGVTIYGINRKDEPAQAQAFLQKYGNPYSGIITDSSGRIGIDWGVYGMPETYVISADGKILKRIVGAITEKHVEELRALKN